MANPIVFFDMAVGGAPIGRIIMELYADMCPITVENFRALCTGEKGMGFFGVPLHYKGSTINYVNQGYIVGGNVISPEYGLGESIYGANFKNEKSLKKHDRPGTLSMYGGVPGKKGLGSLFVICPQKFEYFDNDNYSVFVQVVDNYSVFGQVVEGLNVVHAIGNVELSASGKPVKPVIIADCGQLINTRVFFDIAIGPFLGMGPKQAHGDPLDLGLISEPKCVYLLKIIDL